MLPVDYIKVPVATQGRVVLRVPVPYTVLQLISFASYLSLKSSYVLDNEGGIVHSGLYNRELWKLVFDR